MYILYNGALFLSHKAVEGNTAAQQPSATRLVVFASLIVNLGLSFVSWHKVMYIRIPHSTDNLYIIS